MKMKVVLSVLLFVALTEIVHVQIQRKYFFVNFQRNWTDAQNYCRENFVDLATISSKDEQNQFQVDTEQQCKRTGCLIGLKRDSSSDPFTHWSDGTQFNFTHWSAREPAKWHCVATNDTWFTKHCSNTSMNFVCYVWETKFIVQEKKTWEEALKYCRRNYTDLLNHVTVLDPTSTSKIQTSSFWTGLRFLDGSWFWLNRTRSPMSNMSFMPSCPAPGFRCGAQRTNSGVPEARDCEEKLNFICYYNGTMN